MSSLHLRLPSQAFLAQRTFTWPAFCTITASGALPETAQHRSVCIKTQCNVEEMLAFGRACRDTKNWRAGITLLLADAHRQASHQLAKDEQRKYLYSDEVWKDIWEVYTDYIGHYPYDHVAHSRYAAYSFLCGRHAESGKHFRALGKNFVYPRDFSEKWINEVRAIVAKDQADRSTNKPEKRLEAGC